ncbi:hypothetical protein PHLCEN_2v12267 [Hermanssonia centrifuga]|uniref:Uncharacterized protein n=1 Tax=Hermanssonia centrifuga TaxID=98765 RepID=A0A2R6NHT6_9APHY|nr:hypothetical protein PHLCEN_2v12267 [Hermanssonia centrifuga]
MHELKKDQGVVFRTHNNRGSVTKITCPRLSKRDNKQIASYLQQTMAPGDGGQALHKIALKRYGAKYSELDEEKQEIVDNVQVD